MMTEPLQENASLPFGTELLPAAESAEHSFNDVDISGYFDTKKYYDLKKKQQFFDTHTALQETYKRMKYYIENTNNVSALITRYTKFKRQKKLYEPVGLNIINLAVTFLATYLLRFPVYLLTGNHIITAIILTILFILFYSLIPKIIRIIFNNSYTEYECYVLPKEKKLLYDRLIKEGYCIDDTI